ncbi:hypothetical protein F5880DRAFT_215202 [Lentinula raphanica]|nr:hypothetical protein F5880DRAFT_215202 [Lentinula raphanica]
MRPTTTHFLITLAYVKLVASLNIPPHVQSASNHEVSHSKRGSEEGKAQGSTSSSGHPSGSSPAHDEEAELEALMKLPKEELISKFPAPPGHTFESSQSASQGGARPSIYNHPPGPPPSGPLPPDPPRNNQASHSKRGTQEGNAQGPSTSSSGNPSSSSPAHDEDAELEALMKLPNEELISKFPAPPGHTFESSATRPSIYNQPPGPPPSGPLPPTPPHKAPSSGHPPAQDPPSGQALKERGYNEPVGTNYASKTTLDSAAAVDAGQSPGSKETRITRVHNRRRIVDWDLD